MPDEQLAAKMPSLNRLVLNIVGLRSAIPLNLIGESCGSDRTLENPAGPHEKIELGETECQERPTEKPIIQYKRLLLNNINLYYGFKAKHYIGQYSVS